MNAVLKPATESEGTTRDASYTVKTKSPSNVALLKAGLKSNLSSPEATVQLRVLCRKFAALAGKVKEETKVREGAEREVGRLRALLDGKVSPVVASCRAETQAYIRDLQETQDKLKRELRLEQEKNERVVAKALELEREKKTLLIAAPLLTPTALKTQSTTKLQTAWEKEQVHKIQTTLKLTIEELEAELMRKEQEVQSYRVQSQRDRARNNALENDMYAKDEAQQSAQEARRQLEAEFQQAQTDITSELENMQRIHDQAQEDRAMRETLEQQLGTLNDVNAALEQRSRALIRRLELSLGLTHENQALKLQLCDADAKNEKLVQTIRKLKTEQYDGKTNWTARLERGMEERAQLKQHVHELQEDIASLQAQNSLFSEWMLVRNENALIAQRDATSNRVYSQPQAPSESPPANDKHSWPSEKEHNADYCGDSNNSFQRVNNNMKQSTRDLPRGCDVEQGKSILRSPCDKRKSLTSITPLSSLQSTAITAATSTSSDHERLRKLMSRNRELQQRLQHETRATQNLEQEITSMTL